MATYSNVLTTNSYQKSPPLIGLVQSKKKVCTCVSTRMLAFPSDHTSSHVPTPRIEAAPQG